MTARSSSIKSCRRGPIERELSARSPGSFKHLWLDGFARQSDRALVRAAVGRPQVGTERFEGGFGGAKEPRGGFGSRFERGHRAEADHGLSNAALVTEPPELHGGLAEAFRRTLRMAVCQFDVTEVVQQVRRRGPTRPARLVERQSLCIQLSGTQVRPVRTLEVAEHPKVHRETPDIAARARQVFRLLQQASGLGIVSASQSTRGYWAAAFRFRQWHLARCCRGLPPIASGLMAAMDTYDSPLDMAETASTFGVELTSVESFAWRMYEIHSELGLANLEASCVSATRARLLEPMF